MYAIRSYYVKVWPVPANEMLHINYSEFNNGRNLNLQLINVNGVVVQNVEMNSTSHKDLDVSNIPTGVYLLRMIKSEGTLTKKIVIKH